MKYQPHPEFKDLRFKWPYCGHEMILVQLCGHPGPCKSVDHWWDEECQVMRKARTGSYRCTHEEPNEYLNDPPLLPYGEDMLKKK